MFIYTQNKLSLTIPLAVCFTFIISIITPKAIRAAPPAPLSSPKVEEMILIPEGSFIMGSDASSDETPHDVFLSGFWIDRYEVTQKNFEKVMGSNPSDFKNPDAPVNKVTWYEARDHCLKMGKRLPTEAEWEKAARADTTTTFYWGEKIDSRFAWFWDNSKKSVHPVDEKKPNSFGLHDVSGNVAEWVLDIYRDDYYKKSPPKDPKGPFSGKYRVVRGGSWRDLAHFLRVSRRNYDLPSGRFNHFGFRCVKPLKN